MFHTDSAPGIHPSEVSPQEGIRCVSARKHPLTVPLSSVPAAEAPSRPDEPRFLGFVPSRSPLRPRGCLVHRPPEPPLGFTLPGFFRRRSWPGFRPTSSHGLTARELSPAGNGPSEFRSTYRLAPSTCGAEAPQPKGTTLLGFPHPCLPVHSSNSPSGLMVLPHTPSCIAADRQAISRWLTHSTGVVGTA